MKDLPKSIARIASAVGLLSASALTQSVGAAGPPDGLNVQVTNVPSVTVVNPASVPVPVAISNGAPLVVKPAEVPYSVDSVGTCNTANCFINFPAVPAGKMLVIKYFSTYARPSAGAIFDFAELVASNTQEAGIGTRFIFPMARIGQAGSSISADTYAASGPVLAFARAGTEPRATLTTHVGGTTIFAQGTISGYLIDAPQ